MSPFFASYFDGVDREDFDLLTYLSMHVIPFSLILARNNSDIKRKISTSTSWCHLAARAVATVFNDKGLEVVDGYLYDIDLIDDKASLRSTTHSWCKTKNGSILDVAPVGIVSFMPMLLARKDGVTNTDWGFVTNRYCQTTAVDREIRQHLRTQQFKDGFPTYVSVLKNARKKVDAEILIQKQK